MSYTFLLAKSHSLEIIVAYADNKSLNSHKWNETSLLEITQSLSSFIDWHKCKIPNIRSCVEKFPNSLILLDLSNDLNTQIQISQICNNHFLIHLVYQSKLKFKDEWTYSIVPSNKEQLKALSSIFDYFNWTKGLIFSNQESFEVVEKFSNDFNIFTIETGEGQLFIAFFQIYMNHWNCKFH
ncbi:unnamed protein product [Blepharisma stoltei]|uniref:Receptor ligand binding region domain-containing protein n=1 Tax=Blepharisma stoltei TaxID=1481888 RepID=A0AAU9J183_9CILI|nr:unnamed protein product [Blepharisma stoltei]